MDGCQDFSVKNGKLHKIHTGLVPWPCTPLSYCLDWAFSISFKQHLQMVMNHEPALKFLAEIANRL